MTGPSAGASNVGMISTWLALIRSAGGDPREQDVAAAEAVADPAGGGHRHGERHQVGGHHAADRADRHREVAGQRGQRDVDDGPVHDVHEHRRDEHRADDGLLVGSALPAKETHRKGKLHKSLAEHGSPARARGRDRDTGHTRTGWFTALGWVAFFFSFRLRGPIVESRSRAMTSQRMPSRSITPMPVSQWAASCVHRASGFWPLGPWLVDDWMTFRLIVDATAPRPQRAGAIAAMSPRVPVSGNKPPDSATWTMVTPTRIGMVWSPLVTSVEIARPISMDVPDSTASATKISISAGPGITTPLGGTFTPARPTIVTSADCIMAIRLSTMTFENR